MRFSHSTTTSLVLAAIALCLAAPNAVAGGRGGDIWGPNAMYRNARGAPWDQRGGVDGQADRRWDNSRIGLNESREGFNRRRFEGCGLGGWGDARRGGCQSGFWNEGAYDYSAANAVAAPDYSGAFEGGVIYASPEAAAAPAANPNNACWVLRLAYDKDGSFAGAHRINACLTGPRVIDLSARG